MIHLIDPSDIPSVSKLKKDDVAFPELDYSCYPTIKRKKTTIKGAYTGIINKGFGEYIDELEWNVRGDIDWQNGMLEQLSQTIKQMINEYRKNPSDYLLKKIFIWIQLWGGNEGRHIFVKGGGFKENFRVKIYQNCIKQINNKNNIEALNVLNKMEGLGTSFTTKHLHFWSYGDAPILDRVISQVVFGRKNPSKSPKMYSNYINALDELVHKHGNDLVSRRSIERNLFNWAETAEGKIWSSTRVPETPKPKKVRNP